MQCRQILGMVSKISAPICSFVCAAGQIYRAKLRNLYRRCLIAAAERQRATMMVFFLRPDRAALASNRDVGSGQALGRLIVVHTAAAAAT